MMRTPAFATTLLLALAGCSATPGDDALFPLGEGHRWTYELSTTVDESDTATRETLVLANRGADTMGGAVAWRRRSDSGIEYWLRSDQTGIYRVATRNPLDRVPQADSEPRYVLRKPYVVGTEWDAATTTYVLSRKNEVPHEIRYTQKPVPMHYRIEALGEKVRTPAGQFENCLRVAGRAEVRLYVDALSQWRQIPLATLEWYCPDVGLVRLERKEPSPSRLMVGGSVTMELVSWQ